jgi:hypothetical protein
MTKKDYIAIAEVIRNARFSDDDGDYPSDRRSLAGAIADVMAADNPRFDRDRFLTACGVA